MIDSLTEAKRRLIAGVDRGKPSVESLDADQWVLNSLLQKSIRRGEVEVAQRAALTFLGQRGSAIWRRFMIIAFEDVGAASPDTVAMTVAACTDGVWRKQSGGDAAIAIHLAWLLAKAPKCRSGEHLITAANGHPLYEHERCQVSNRSITDNLAAVGDKSNSLIHRGVAAWRVSGVGWKRTNLPGSDVSGLLSTFVRLGVPNELVEATGIAVSRVRDATILMVPLTWLAANDERAPVATMLDTPRSLVVDGVPMYALDKHTRVGREAIRKLVKYNAEIRDCLKRCVAPAQRHDAAYMAAFYADAAPLAFKLSWDGADQLEALGTEADLLKVGVAPEGVVPLLKVFKANVQHLNRIRAYTICRKRGSVDIAAGLLADEEELGQ
jgi:hypothetical protein